MGKIHEAHPQHRSEPLCGLPTGKTRAGKPGLRVQCKNCLRLMASRKVIARRVALRTAERKQRRAAARHPPGPPRVPGDASPCF